MTPDLPPTPPDAPPQAAIVAPAAAPLVVESNGYRYTVRGDLRLPPEAIAAAIAASASPKEAVDAINRLYQQRGYFLTGMRGAVDGKEVAIEIIRGRITEAEIPPALAPYFRGLKGRDDLDRRAVIERATIAEAYAGREGKRPVINFAPAAEVGGSKIVVTEDPIEGYSPWNAGLGFNNLGSRFSSRYVAQASVAARPGGGLELTANIVGGLPGLSSDSSGSQYSAGVAGLSLVTPWGIYSGSISSTHYRIGERAAPLYPDGLIETGTVSGNQLVYADERSRLSLTEAYTYTSNIVTVFEDFFTLTEQRYGFLSLGANFGTTFAVLGHNAGLAVGATVSKGVSPRTGTFLPDEIGAADPRFSLVQGTLAYSQALPLGLSASLNWSGQWSDYTVPQNQQWVLGGFGNLTAYVPAVMAGDSGSLTRVGLNSPPWSWKGASVSGAAFFEAGVARTAYTPPLTPRNRWLSDAGLSITSTIPGGTGLTLAYAWPLWQRNVDDKALDQMGRAHLYFSLTQTF